jgi:hypothetical protein
MTIDIVRTRELTVLCQRLPEVGIIFLPCDKGADIKHVRLNVKLGGINCVPLAQDVPVLTDHTNPTIVLG